jgi:DNA (cytosine-5)-methyltransferase 1
MPNTPASRFSVPVIDLFAGPGGLGEGFGAFQAGGETPFDVRLSIEKDPVACKTLLGRKFFRSFAEPPAELLEYFKGAIELEDVLAAFPNHAASAKAAVWAAELGKIRHQRVTAMVNNSLGGAADWVLLGGPPCQAYSIAGRSRMRTTRKDFEFDERHFLYREYLRIVADHEPAVFVLENVKGLLTSQHGGERIVSKIIDDLRAPSTALGLNHRGERGYRLHALTRRQGTLFWESPLPPDGEQFLIRAEEYGIPQMRHRIFIVGVRNDIDVRPALLEPRDEITVNDVLSDLPPIRSQLSKEPDSIEGWRDAITAIAQYPWMSATAHEYAGVAREVRRITAEMSSLAFGTGARHLNHRRAPKALGEWYRHDATGLTHHESRSHMRTDLHRYLFAATFAKIHGRSPELKNFPKELRPAHRNIAETINGGEMFNDRFRVQLGNRPSTTITSHISKDGHYYIHSDPFQCRSLTVREAARLQTFPDSYFFAGNRTQQYHQVGNAVPPLLAMDIAGLVYDLLVRGDKVAPIGTRLKKRGRTVRDRRANTLRLTNEA